MQFCLQEKHQKIFLKRVLIDENQPCVCAHKTQQKQIVFIPFACKRLENEVFKYFLWSSKGVQTAFQVQRTSFAIKKYLKINRKIAVEKEE